MKLLRRALSRLLKMVLEVKIPTPSDLEIAQSAEVLHITEIARKAGIQPDELLPYGDDKAKVG